MAFNSVNSEKLTENLGAFAEKKSKRDAAYLAFKQDPTTVNMNVYNQAAQDFNQYCIDAASAIYYTSVGAQPAEISNEEILRNWEAYATCHNQRCNATLLFKVTDNDFIEASNFVREAKGWCYDCLVEHCKNTTCGEKSCTLIKEGLVEKVETCPFRALAEIRRTLI